MADKSKIQSILELCESGTVRSYSGRAMYGKECVGFDTDEGMGDMFAEILELADEDDLPELAEAFRGMRTDSMGRGTIVYFPRTPFVSDEDEDEDEDEDDGEADDTELAAESP